MPLPAKCWSSSAAEQFLGHCLSAHEAHVGYQLASYVVEAGPVCDESVLVHAELQALGLVLGARADSKLVGFEEAQRPSQLRKQGAHF